MDPWDIAKAFADALGIGSVNVLPIWGLDTLFADRAANYYIWPPAGQRTAIVAWLTEHGCAWRAHPDDPCVIVARGSQVTLALHNIHHTKDTHV